MGFTVTVLKCPLILVIFDNFQKLEERLNKIRSIPGIEELRREYRGSKAPNHGDITDQRIKDMLAEILILDFLIELGFTNIRKQLVNDNKAHPDITASHNGKNYAVEVTRKQEIGNWKSLSYGGLEDCDAPTNHDKIRTLILKALVSKEKQFVRAVNDNTIDTSTIKVVVIKTSDYGFAECIVQARQIVNELLSESETWKNIDCLWLVPNIVVDKNNWLCKTAIHNPLETT